MTKTQIIVTGNLHAWHEATQRHTAPDADAEPQKIAGMIRDQLHKITPEIIPKEDH